MNALTERQRIVLQAVIFDMEYDAAMLDGKPFNGATVAEAIGKLCAAVSIVAEIVLDASSVDTTKAKLMEELG